MFMVVVSVQVVRGAHEEFLAGITENALRSVQEEEECFAFEVIETGDPGSYLFVERYASAEAFAFHRTTPHLAAWRKIADRVLVPGSQVVQTGTVVAGTVVAGLSIAE